MDLAQCDLAPKTIFDAARLAKIDSLISDLSQVSTDYNEDSIYSQAGQTRWLHRGNRYARTYTREERIAQEDWRTKERVRQIAKKAREIVP